MMRLDHLFHRPQNELGVDQRTKCKTENMKLLDENQRVNLHHVGFGGGILYTTLKHGQRPQNTSTGLDVLASTAVLPL